MSKNISISDEVYDKLTVLKIYPRDSYNDVIVRLLESDDEVV